MDSLLLQPAIQALAARFEASLAQFMPAVPLREFQLWALHGNERRTWWEILGIPQFATLTVSLLSDLVSETEWERVLAAANRMNQYLIYEAMSDNFASHLQFTDQQNPLRQRQALALTTFNNAMLSCLAGSKAPIPELLAPAADTLEQLSYFQSSVAGEALAQLADRFVVQHPAIQRAELEFGGQALLVANIEAGVELSQLLEPYGLGPFFRQGLARRYSGMNRLLEQPALSWAEMIDLSTDSVLVIPFLTYYLSLLYEVLSPPNSLASLVETGLLESALSTAALLVRLANDVGTPLLLQEAVRSEFFARLSAREAPDRGMNDILLDLAETLPYLTRFHKDIVFGEYNTCLYNVRGQVASQGTLAQLKYNLVFLAKLYQQKRGQLLGELEAITQRLGDPRASKLILRFVVFHEQLYRSPFDSQAGDYATKPAFTPHLKAT